MGDRQVVFWDFDGTLAAREGTWPTILRDAIIAVDPGSAVSDLDLLPQLQQGFPNWKPGQLRVYPSAAAWWAAASSTLLEACSRAGIDPSTAKRSIAELPRIYYDPGSWRILPGAFEALALTSSAGMTNVVLSNHAPELPQLVEQLGLAPLIERTITSAFLGAEKPNPIVYYSALRLTGAKADSWMIGDNQVADVDGARAVGLRAVLVHRTTDAQSSLSLLGAAKLVVSD